MNYCDKEINSQVRSINILLKNFNCVVVVFATVIRVMAIDSARAINAAMCFDQILHSLFNE